MDMWVPDEGEALYRKYPEKADGFRRDAEDVRGRYGNTAFGFLHLFLLGCAVFLSYMFPEVGAFPSFALPFTGAALTFASFFSLNMIRALSDKEREYE